MLERMAQLQETQRPIQSIEEDVKRLTAELAAKAAAFAQVEEENRTLRGDAGADPRCSRGARISDPPAGAQRNQQRECARTNSDQHRAARIRPHAARARPAGSTEERLAELIRLDGENPISHVLARRTRIGRAAGCELQIDSSSVSRHHALLLVGPRETVIEDLNSTNGVLVNGRKVTRQVLTDGDSLTIGETQFRYFVRPPQREPAPSPRNLRPSPRNLPPRRDFSRRIRYLSRPPSLRARLAQR